MRNISRLKLHILLAVSLILSSCHCDHEEEPTATFKPGHVLCTDGSVLSLCDYVKSKKQAVGIIFHVDDNVDSDILGYAVYINKTPALAFADECGISQGTSASLENRDGNGNTYSIFSTEEVKSPIADYVFNMWTFGQSCYIPSVAELRLLFLNKDFVNERILAVGGDPIESDDERCWLWTSTEVEGQQNDKAWLFSMNYGSIQETPKNQAHEFRPIIEIRK